MNYLEDYLCCASFNKRNLKFLEKYYIIYLEKMKEEKNMANYNYKPKRNCENCANLIKEISFNGGVLYKCAKTGKYLTLADTFKTNCLLGALFKYKDR